MPVIKEKKDGNPLRLPIRSPDFLCTCSTFTVYHIVCRHEHWIADRKLFRRTHCCTTESMTAEETTASTSLLKDCFPGSGIEEVHVLVVDMQAHMSAGFHLGTRIELRHNAPARHCQVVLTQHSAPAGSERKCNVTCCTVTSPGTSGEAKQTLLHPTASPVAHLNLCW